jgi:hypothetical protein
LLSAFGNTVSTLHQMGRPQTGIDFSLEKA